MKLKNNFAVVLLFVSSLAGLKAQDAIDKYFGQYANDPDFTSIVISSKMFQMFSAVNADDPNGKKMKEAISGLQGIRILTYDQEGSKASMTDYKDLIKKVGPDYEMLMSVDDKDEKVRFFVREDGDLIKELFMIVGGRGNLFLMSLIGNIDLEKMSNLSKSMNIGGMNYLQNLDQNDKQK